MDFERWMQRQGRDEPRPESESCTEILPATEAELPDGLWQYGDGVYQAVCRSCHRTYDWYGEPLEFTQDMSYCGGSQYCLP